MPKIEVGEGVFTIHTKQDPTFKRHLRDNILEGVNIENIPGRYCFIINDLSSLEDKIKDIEIKERAKGLTFE